MMMHDLIKKVGALFGFSRPSAPLPPEKPDFVIGLSDACRNPFKVPSQQQDRYEKFMIPIDYDAIGKNAAREAVRRGFKPYITNPNGDFVVKPCEVPKETVTEYDKASS